MLSDFETMLAVVYLLLVSYTTVQGCKHTRCGKHCKALAPSLSLAGSCACTFVHAVSWLIQVIHSSFVIEYVT